MTFLDINCFPCPRARRSLYSKWAPVVDSVRASETRISRRIQDHFDVCCADAQAFTAKGEANGAARGAAFELCVLEALLFFGLDNRRTVVKAKDLPQKLTLDLFVVGRVRCHSLGIKVSPRERYKQESHDATIMHENWGGAADRLMRKNGTRYDKSHPAVSWLLIYRENDGDSVAQAKATAASLSDLFPHIQRERVITVLDEEAMLGLLRDIREDDQKVAA